MTEIGEVLASLDERMKTKEAFYREKKKKQQMRGKYKITFNKFLQIIPSLLLFSHSEGAVLKKLNCGYW